MPSKSNKTKWKPFNFHDSTDADQVGATDSAPLRTASNPITSSQHSLSGSDRRTVSEYRPRVPYLDTPLCAAELQKLHESREREAAQAAGSSEQASAPPSVSASLTTPSPEPVLRISTNYQSDTAKADSSSKPASAAVPNFEIHVRSDSVAPLFNENTVAETRCSSSSPDKDSGAAAKGVTTVGDDMASATRVSGRPNRFENRPPMSTILCRNGPQCRKLQEGTDLLRHSW